jgi:hypothetical protein
MATTITGTGDFQPGAHPTITISSGRGNTAEPEVHLIIRDADGDTSKTVMAWVRRDDLLAAISKEDSKVRLAVETGEPS